MKKASYLILLIIILFSLNNCKSIEDVLDNILVENSELDMKTIIKGLKEALNVGTKQATRLISKKDGYFKNKAIKVLLPNELQEVEKVLRNIGLGYKVDEFILSMNRAAEKAAPKAVDIIVKAVSEMTIEDAKNILYGDDNKAATKYFEKHTRTELFKIFKPIIRDAMDSVGVTNLFKYILTTYNNIPGVQKVKFDLDKYVTDKALDGLFHMVAQEEIKIRKDPAARVTDLLKQVFGTLDKK